MTHIEEFGKLLDDFSKVFEQLTSLQQEKIQAVQQDDLQSLDHCMQREQALSLQIRGLQRKKDKTHEALGMQAVSLRQVPEHLSAEDRAQIEPAISHFQTAYEIYSSSATASRAVLETVLQEINHALEESKAPPQAKAPNRQGNFTDIKA